MQLVYQIDGRALRDPLNAWVLAEGNSSMLKIHLGDYVINNVNIRNAKSKQNAFSPSGFVRAPTF